MNTLVESTPIVVSGKYLTFLLASEAYGIAVRNVREIIRHQPITPVPQMPDFVKGVVNLRGRVIPVLDLRVKVGLKAEFTERTCVVVVQIPSQSGGARQMGLIVDGVEEVANFSAADIEPSPEFGTTLDSSYILGLAKAKGQLKTLLSIERLIAPATAQALLAAS
jgi:purine-binding chemotaxis protein CheW